MRKVIAVEFVTLDGFISGPNGELDWFVHDDPEIPGGQLDSVDTFLFGRRTYELMVSHWPTATDDNPVIIAKMNNTPKIVFSKTLNKVEWGRWNNAKLVKENVVETVNQMKKQPGKDMVILGSGTLVSSFLKLGLIDEYQILLHPIVLGRGKPLFRDLSERQKLELIGTKTFKSGVVGLYYRPTN